MLKKQKKGKRNIFLILCLIVALIGVAGLSWFTLRDNRSNEISQSQKDSIEGQLDRENQAIRQGNENGEKKPNSVNSNLTEVTPVIARSGTYEGSVEAAGFIQGIYEEGGTCTYTFTNGSKIITKDTSGFKDATTTTCTPASVSLSEFPESGAWTVKLSYKSSISAGSSKEESLNF